jgi:hypothetical protein
MKRNTRRILITLCVIMGVVVVLSVAVRVILTRDVLVDLVVPRLERVVGARISIGDIGVRFPFGFGVDIKDLSFQKAMPQGETIAFESETLVARASLLSLVKRKPVIKRVDVSGGKISVTGGRQTAEALVEGFSANLSMSPVAGGYRIAAAISAESVEVSVREKPGLSFGDVRFEGDMTLDAAFDSLHIIESKADWGTFASFDVSGDIWNLKTSRNLSLGVSSGGIEIPLLLERIAALGVLPAATGPDGRPAMPVAIRKGSFTLASSAVGSMARPSEISFEGTIGLEGLEMEHPAFEGPFAVRGDIAFSESNLKAEGLSVSFGSSRADIGLDVTVVERRRPESIGVTCDAELRVEDLVPRPARKDIDASGAVDLKLRVRGTPADLALLFPPAGKKVSPEGIGAAWKRVGIEGTTTFRGVSVETPGSPFRFGALEGSAAIKGGDVKELRFAFLVNGSPYRCRATLEGVMPAGAELITKARGADPSAFGDLGPLLANLKNAPRISASIEGRSLDIRPFEKKGAAETEEKGAAEGKPAPAAAPANPLMILALKNTSFEAGIDSVVTTKAVFTSIEAKGVISDGILRADPVTLRYAGGAGRARLETDLRKPKRIESRVDLSFENVQAGSALGAMHPLGNLLKGTFTFSSNASFASGPGLDPLLTLSGEGSALSSTGTLDISRFLAPITQTGLINLSHLERFDFKDWRGSFLIKDGRFMTDDWKIRSSKGDWAIRGSFGFDGTIDYRAHIVVPPAVQREMKDLSKYRDLVDLFRDAEGNIVLDIDIGGTGRDPKISLDMSATKDRAAEKAVDSILKRAKDLFKK